MSCEIHVIGGTVNEAERNAYLNRAIHQYGCEPKHMDIAVDGEFVNLTYDFGDMPFQRIRRITGYLVGTLDRFNNAKRSEERDRIKHGLTELEPRA